MKKSTERSRSFGRIFSACEKGPTKCDNEEAFIQSSFKKSCQFLSPFWIKFNSLLERNYSWRKIIKCLTERENRRHQDFLAMKVQNELSTKNKEVSVQLCWSVWRNFSASLLECVPILRHTKGLPSWQTEEIVYLHVLLFYFWRGKKGWMIEKIKII